MTRDKMIIYMHSPQRKLWITVVYLCIIMLLTLPFLVFALSVKGIPWYGVVLIMLIDTLFLGTIFLVCFGAIVLDEERGMLLLRDFGVRSIPIQDIKVIKRDEYVYMHRGGDYCCIDIQLIKGDKKRIHLDAPRIGRKKWLEYIDEELARMNVRIDEWYMEYRKKNKKNRKG